MMQHRLAGLLSIFLTGSLVSSSRAQTTGGPGAAPAERDSVRKGEYALVFINYEPGFDTVTKKRMFDAFFAVYPAEASRFNKNTLRRVTFVIDPAYRGVAGTDEGIVRYNPH